MTHLCSCYRQTEARCNLSTQDVLGMLPSRGDERERKHSRSDSAEKRDEMDVDGDAPAAEAAVEGKRAEAKDSEDANRNYAIGQIARILAKQQTRKLRQQYKRKPQHPMSISGVDPFIGSSKPASNYLCLDIAPPAALRVAERKAIDGGSSDDSECSESESDSDDDDDSDDDADADLPGNDEHEPGDGGGAGEDSKDSKDSKHSQDSDSNDGKDGKERSGKDEKVASAPASHVMEMPLSVAFFAENAFVEELLDAGVSKRGRKRKLTGTSATALFTGTSSGGT
jgi:hypothetical protein